MTAPAEDPRVGEVCGRSFRSGSGRYYDCGRTTGHEGGHAICDPAPAPERDAVDAEAARLWAERHDDHSGPFWHASCPACTATPAEAFRLGFRAARPAGDRAQPTQDGTT
jgi:hypothetical protein